MRPTLVAAVAIAGLAPLSGCSVWRYARLACVEEPKQFCDWEDDKASQALYRTWAEQAWAEHGADACPEACNLADYGWGFREGFTEFVYAGGDGEPPAVPPRPYWQTDLRSAEGARAAQSWFEGYRHGARVARDGGYRKCAVLRVSASLADCGPCGCPADSVAAPLPQAGPELGPPNEESAEIVLPVPQDASPSELPLPPEAPELEPATPDEPRPSPEPSPERRVTRLETERSEAPRGEIRTAVFQIVR